MERDYRVNQRIRSATVRVIGNAGEQLGIMPFIQALNLAREQGLDLVEVAPNSDPPVCRILDYGKLRYLQAKKARDAKKTQKVSPLREIRFRPNISEHDLSSKLRKLKEFLTEDGSKVKVTVTFRGRQMSRPEIGITLLKRVAETVKLEGKLERAPSMEGRMLSVILAPMAKKVEQKAEEVKNAQT